MTFALGVLTSMLGSVVGLAIPAIYLMRYLREADRCQKESEFRESERLRKRTEDIQKRTDALYKRLMGEK